MSESLKLVVFDCDGTLVDSQHCILECMERAFDAEGMARPDLHDVRRIVGLELVEAISVMRPELSMEVCHRLGEGYKRAFQQLRQDKAEVEPLFQGIESLLDWLDQENVLMAIATGKGQRGLLNTLDLHGLNGRFLSLQTVDSAPGKPHPGMVLNAMNDTGVAPENTVVIGDTTFDMMMAKNACVSAIGVNWGYHEPEELVEHGAHGVAQNVDHLRNLINEVLR